MSNNEINNNSVITGASCIINDRDKSTNNIHYKWVIGCLLVLIVILAAFIFFDKQSDNCDIIGYLSFASLILSILLSIFAILFSYYSSGQIDSKLADIEKAVAEIKSANTVLSTSNQSLISSLLIIQEKIGSIEAKQAYSYHNNNNEPDSIKSITISNTGNITSNSCQPPNDE